MQGQGVRTPPNRPLYVQVSRRITAEALKPLSLAAMSASVMVMLVDSGEPRGWQLRNPSRRPSAPRWTYAPWALQNVSVPVPHTMLSSPGRNVSCEGDRT